MEELPLTRAAWVDLRLRAAILSGELEPGQRLRTEQLARDWEVSPTPLRETYHRLAAEGLIELLPQRGARVAGLSSEEAHDIYSLRLLLEPRALRLSLANRDAGWERASREAHAALTDELERGATDLVAFEEAHRQFHRALIARCGSPWMMRIIAILQDHSVRYRLLSLTPRGGADEVLAEHESLFDACLRGDIDTATDRLTGHLQLTLDALPQLSGPAASAVGSREEKV